MADKKLRGIKKNRLQRRLAVSMAGMKATSAVLSSRSADWLRSEEGRRNKRSQVLARETQKFVAELGKLKGSYVKIGQMLALFGEHFLPPELTEALHGLNDQTQALEWRAMEPQLVEELGSRLDELEIDPEPLAAASLGQVHRAVIKKTGEEICLKLRYPGVAETIDSDFADVVRMLRLMRFIQAGRDLDEFLEEVCSMLHDEVNYRREADMTEYMSDHVADDDRFIIPKVYRDYCSDSVLALEYLPGYEVTSDKVKKLPLAQRNHLAQAMLDLFLREVFDWGVLQTDPNFGNYRILLDGDKPRLVLLDFGAVCEFSDDFLDPLRATIVHAFRDNLPGVVEGVVGLRCVSSDHPEEVQESFARFCMQLLEPLEENLSSVPKYALNSRGEYKWAKSQLIKRAGKMAAKSSFSPHFTLPPKEFALIARKLTGVFTFISVLRAEFNGSDCLAGYVQEWESK